MKIKLLIGVLFMGLISYYSCQKENNPSGYPFKAEVMGINPDCGIYQIRITDGQEKAESIVGKSAEANIYIANNLPDELKINGLRIILDLRKPEINELGVCTDMGPSYTWVFVTKAKKEQNAL
jgi:hypothetical protein